MGLQGQSQGPMGFTLAHWEATLRIALKTQKILIFDFDSSSERF
jgi:hypothetical protein